MEVAPELAPLVRVNIPPFSKYILAPDNKSLGIASTVMPLEV